MPSDPAAHSSVDAYLEGLPPAHREICAALRALVRDSIAGVEEKWSWSRPVYAAGGKDFCYLVANKADVNLGFNRGAELADPKRLLKGSGKAMRHLKLKSVSEIDAPAVQRMLKQAANLAEGS
jgi:hypothetical protein